MKRVKAACICQTLHFMLKEDMEHARAVEQVQAEVAHYKRTLERSGVRHRILDEAVQPDGSMVVRVVKQYNSSPVGSYLDDAK